MDLIRAYACGLLPDMEAINDRAYEVNRVGIYKEFADNIDDPDKEQIYRKIRTSVWVAQGYNDGYILSARLLCQRLLAYYEQQQGLK